MTEESFQKCRKIMQTANYLRGMITTHKNNCIKWSNMELANRANLQHEKADGCKKMLDISMNKLDKAKQKFADLKFPDSNIKAERREMVQCEVCGELVSKGTTYCDKCSNQ